MIDENVVLLLLSFGLCLLVSGINAAANALGRRDDLNLPVSPSLAGDGGSVARTLIPGEFPSETPRSAP